MYLLINLFLTNIVFTAEDLSPIKNQLCFPNMLILTLKYQCLLFYYKLLLYCILTFENYYNNNYDDSVNFGFANRNLITSQLLFTIEKIN